jgi:hypothetical protein
VLNVETEFILSRFDSRGRGLVDMVTFEFEEISRN